MSGCEKKARGSDCFAISKNVRHCFHLFQSGLFRNIVNDAISISEKELLLENIHQLPSQLDSGLKKSKTKLNTNTLCLKKLNSRL